MKIAAIYARVSSDKQNEENTIFSQTAALKEFADTHKFNVPEEWVFCYQNAAPLSYRNVRTILRTGL